MGTREHYQCTPLGACLDERVPDGITLRVLLWALAQPESSHTMQFIADELDRSEQQIARALSVLVDLGYATKTNGQPAEWTFHYPPVK